MRQMGYFFLPECCKDLILGLEFVDPDHLSAKLPARVVMDQHAIAPEFPADRGTIGINCARKTLTCGIFAHECASFLQCILSITGLFKEFFVNLISKLRLHVNEE
jgi:hypothetical protein